MRVTEGGFVFSLSKANSYTRDEAETVSNGNRCRRSTASISVTSVTASALQKLLEPDRLENISATCLCLHFHARCPFRPLSRRPCRPPVGRQKVSRLHEAFQPTSHGRSVCSNSIVATHAGKKERLVHRATNNAAYQRRHHFAEPKIDRDVEHM